MEKGFLLILLFLILGFAYSQDQNSIIQQDEIISASTNNTNYEFEISQIKMQIENTHQQNSLILKKLNEKNKIFNSIIEPLLLSLFSAILFWVLFSVIPQHVRKRKVRSTVDMIFMQIYQSLFTIFDIALKHQDFSPSYFQTDIQGNRITKELFRIGLKNKILNDTFRIYPKINDSFITIGQTENELKEKINTYIDRLLNFETLLSIKQVNLLITIRKELETYHNDVTRNAETIINGQRLYPRDPSMSYKSENYISLYELYKQIEKIAFKSHYFDRNLYLNMIQSFYYSKKYLKCIFVILQNKHKFEKDLFFSNYYIILSLFDLKQYRLARFMFAKIAKSGAIDIISQRSWIKHIFNDEHILKIIEETVSNQKIEEYKKIIKDEEIRKTIFLENNRVLDKMFAMNG